jgi:DNA helicase-2/ATP-dependent DNA helicase PcrA
VIEPPPAPTLRPARETRASRSRGTVADGAPVRLEGVAALLAGLDRDQKRAVTHGDGPLLVVAGPGTGKTRVVTHRIAWLIATKRARPSEILALTFTDGAAEEMQERVDVLVPYGYADIAVSTFHAFGDRLVREFAFELGLPADPRVLTRADVIVFLREHLFELGLERYRPLGDPTHFLGALAGLFSRAKDEAVAVDDYLAHATRLESSLAAARASAGDRADERADALADLSARQTELALAYVRYQELLARAGLIDFGDQVSLALRLLREQPSVRAEIGGRYRYVLVDEFQDTNAAQLELVEMVAGGHRNITVVGDDDQSIYTFRGAALSNLLGFAERFRGARTVVLRRNHRSRRPILEAAYRLIRHNDPCRLEARAGLDKRPRPARRARRPKPVEHRAFASIAEEADWIAAAAEERLRRGQAATEIAILVRTNADAEPFLRSLNLRGISWRFSGASGLDARPEVRELLCFLRVVADLDSTVDLYAVATGEPYRLGGADLTALLGLARRRHRSLWWACREALDQPGLIRLESSTRRGLERLRDDLAAASELAHCRPAGEVLYDHLKRSGRLARLTAATDPRSETAMRNVARFFELVRTRSRLLEDDRVPFLAPHLAMLLEAGEDAADEDADDSDAVAVLTIHKAKGLEFGTVFLAGLAEGRFPRRGRRDPLALPEELCRDRRTEAFADEATDAEERRLCYVAMTRARDELILTHAAASAIGRRRRPSPFISEALDRPAVPVKPQADALALLEGQPDPGPVPLPARPPAGGRLELSFSQVDDYLTCPLRYRLRHVVGVPVPAHHALSYGGALHQAVAAEGLRRMKGRPMSADELVEVYRLHWSSEGFLSREHEDARFAAGEAALRRYHAEHCAVERPAPLAVEEPFAVELGGDRVRGRFDRLDREPEGIVVTDFKSSDVRDPQKARQRARQSLQLSIYALAQEALAGEPPAAVRLHFLDSGLVAQVPLEPSRLEDARRKVRAAADGIRQGAFEPRPDQVACSYCPFRDICPASAA